MNNSLIWYYVKLCCIRWFKLVTQFWSQLMDVKCQFHIKPRNSIFSQCMLPEALSTFFCRTIQMNYPNTTIVMKFMEYYFSVTIFIGLLKVRPSSVDKTSNVTIRKAVISDYFLKISFCTRKLLRSVDTNIIVFKDQNHVVFFDVKVQGIGPISM